MIDFDLIEGFDRDDGNHRKSLDRHGVSQEECQQVFIDPRLLILTDDKHSGAKDRYHAYGQSATGRLLLVSFTLRRNRSLLRVISARDMSRKEKDRYAEEEA
jgi:uncharacterized DUF497 family protein